MIREHVENSIWWGRRVGILSDPSFFALPGNVQEALLDGFDWVEFRWPLQTVPPAQDLLRAGFAAIDVQIAFRISLKGLRLSTSLDSMRTHFADDAPFVIGIDDPKDFLYERFWHLPGMTTGKMRRRYIHWAKQLIERNPKWCLEVSYDGNAQGWFLSEPIECGLNLTLAMLHRSASISGLHLYHKALAAYAERGATLGIASFSVSNIDVHNIYSHFGAKFTSAIGCWLWLRDRSSEK